MLQNLKVSEFSQAKLLELVYKNLVYLSALFQQHILANLDFAFYFI